MAVDQELNSANLLILDDEPANILLLERILKKEGYTNIVTLTRSTDLFEGTELYRADILLLDLLMPPPDGFTVLERIRASDEGHPLPILVLTADMTARSRHRALELGANDYLTKPFDPMDVVLRVRNLLLLRFLHRRLLKTNRLLQERVLELENQHE